MNKWMWIGLIGFVVLVLAANGALWWPAELAIGLLVGLVATVLGILAAVVSVPLALLAAAFATVVALAVAAVVTLLALLPVLLPLALLAGFVWLVVKLASASASTAPPALPASVAAFRFCVRSSQCPGWDLAKAAFWSAEASFWYFCFHSS